MTTRFRLLVLVSSALASVPVARSEPAIPGGMVAGDQPVGIRRGLWGGTEIKARLGARLLQGDLVAAAFGSKLLCDDLTFRELSDLPKPLPCPEDLPVSVRGTRHSPARAATPPEVPTVITPRSGRIRDAHPRLRWRSIPGVTTYDVELLGLSPPWSASVHGTELRYPEDAPVLAGNGRYKLRVHAGIHTSDEDRRVQWFSPLAAEDARAVADRLTAVGQLPLGAEARGLVEALVLEGKQLNAEALDRLEAVRDPKEPVIPRTIGRMYLEAGLDQEAERALTRALEMSKAIDDPLGQAEAEQLLASLFLDVIGDAAAGRAHLESARDAFKKLGDRETVAAIEQRLEAVTEE